MSLVAYIDGGCEPVNPGGTASWGAVVIHNGSTVWEGYGIVGRGPAMSNNVAEYHALLELLKWMEGKKFGEPKLEILSDSRMLVQQMLGKFQVKKGLYVVTYQKVKDQLEKNPKWKGHIIFRWIPREKNIADALTVKALSERGIHRKG